jgi:hypothetical protein
MRFMALAALLCMMSSGANAVNETAKKELWAGTMDVGPCVFRFRIESVTNEDGLPGNNSSASTKEIRFFVSMNSYWTMRT